MSDISPAAIRRARLAVTLVFLVNGTGIGLWGGHVAWLQARHGLDHLQLAFALLALAAGAIVAMSGAGWLTARFGSRRCIEIAGPAFCLLLMMPYLAPSLGTLMAAGVLVGAANGTMDVAMNAHGAVVERLRRQPTMSSFHAFFSLGGVAGAGTAATLLAFGLTPDRTMPVLAVALTLLLAIAVVGLLRDVTGEGGSAGLVVPSLLTVQIGAVAFLAMAGEGAVLDWIGVYLSRVLAAPLSTAALGVAAFALAMTLGRLTGDRMVRRFGDREVLRGSAAGATAGLVAVLLAPTPAAALMAVAAVGFGIANIIPILFMSATRLPGIAPGQGLAAVAMIGYSGFLVAPPAIGAVADIWGLNVALWLVVIAMAVVAAAAPRLQGGRSAVSAPPA